MGLLILCFEIILIIDYIGKRAIDYEQFLYWLTTLRAIQIKSTDCFSLTCSPSPNLNFTFEGFSLTVLMDSYCAQRLLSVNDHFTPFLRLFYEPHLNNFRRSAAGHSILQVGDHLFRQVTVCVHRLHLQLSINILCWRVVIEGNISLGSGQFKIWGGKHSYRNDCLK